MRNLLANAARAAIFTSSLAGVAANAGQNVCEPEMAAASAAYDIPLGVLYAVGLTETGNEGSLHANAMNIEGRAYFAKSAADAVAEFNAARAGGAKLIDLGCMQINHHFHAEHFASVEDMLDPRQNVEYAARFLNQLRAREGSWTMAVARYHAGPNNDPAQKRYVCAVIANMVATGFGAWTPESKSFCE
jgi:soluble lytic murein transglycosylase-like protein